MKHIRTFEDLDYRGQIEAENNLRREIDKDRNEQIERIRKETSGKYLPKLIADKNKRDEEFDISGPGAVQSRKVIVDKVITGLTNDLNRVPGYQSFREELLSFLNEFPKE